MKIKWYWPMEILGLVKDLTGEYNDGYTHYEVSRRCDELMKILLWGLFPALFLLGFLARRCLARAGQDPFGKAGIRWHDPAAGIRRPVGGGHWAVYPALPQGRRISQL